ncbi:MAG: serine hydrolase [Thermoleophilaceae bacterium]
MGRRVGVVSTVVAIACALAAAAPAQAARSCEAPDRRWERATPAEAGMDAAGLRDAMDYGTSQLAFAVRVYRHGCLVAEDGLAELNRNAQYESWSLAKSVTSLVFGRAMTLGLISPDDPVGALVPAADREHGAITMRDLLTMTSGLRWNGLRDYNVFTMPDRIRDALTLGLAHPPGTYFEYAQSAVSLLAEAVERAAGVDFERWAQLNLMSKLGIKGDSWFWVRDKAENAGGFYGVNMRPDDFGRLGELIRRDGVWRGERLLSREYVTRAITPTETNGCYGWLIWLNSGAPCMGPRITERPVSDERQFPGLPSDMFRFSGLFGQLVAVFPSQGIVMVRTGQDPNLVFSGGQGWEHELYRRILGSVTDQEIAAPDEPQRFEPSRENPDAGFQNALAEPDQYSKGVVQDPLPPAGPARARAARLPVRTRRVSRRGTVAMRLVCPERLPDREPQPCSGEAVLEGARSAVGYDAAPGETVVLRFRVAAGELRALRAEGSDRLTLTAVNRDATGGTQTNATYTVRPPR